MSTSPARPTRAATRPAAAKKPATKTAAKTAARKAARDAAAKPAKAAPPAASAPAAAAAVVDKAPKAKLVRDSFTIPADEYAELDRLKQRALKLAHPAKKSELLRAGIKALAVLSDAALLAALNAVPAIKTGRPKTRKSDKPEKADRPTTKKKS